MEINYIFNFWDSLFAITSILIGAIITLSMYKLSKQLSAKDKYLHEMKITKEIKKIDIYNSIILADVLKYNSFGEDNANKTYHKQRAELYAVIPEYGVQFILMPNDKNIPVGLVPFEWIEYVRESDSEDNKPVVVCKFKGVRWYENFKSPFKEISYVYENSNYNENTDPKFLKFTTTKPNLSKLIKKQKYEK